MKLSLVWITLFYVAGILIGAFFPTFNALIFLILIAFVFALAYWFRVSSWASFLICLLIVLLGAFSAQKALYSFSSSHLLYSLPAENKKVTIKALVVDEPQRQKFRTKKGRKIKKTKVLLEAQSLLTDSGWKEVRGTILGNFYWLREANQFEIGEEIELKAKIILISGKGGYFDYLRRKRILFKVNVSSSKNVRSLGVEKGKRVKRKLFQWRQFLEKKLAYGLESQAHRQILMGLVFGTRADFSKELKSLLLKTNTYHIMAISGFNMCLVILIITAFLSALGLPQKGVALIMIGVVIFYVALVGWPPSATRAGLMSIVVLIAQLIDREVVTLNAMAMSALLILLFSPMQLFMPGFQLSYVVVLCLILFGSKWHRFLKETWVGKRSLRERGEWKQRLKKITLTLLMAFGVSLIAWLSVLPLLLFYFGSLTLYSVFTNLFILFIVSNLTYLGLAAMSLNLIDTRLGLFLNEVNALLMDVLLGILRFFEKLPGCYLEVGKLPSFFLILFYFALLYFVYVKITRKYEAF